MLGADTDHRRPGPGADRSRTEVNDILARTPSRRGPKKPDAYAKSNTRAQGLISQLAQDIADYSNKTLTATSRRPRVRCAEPVLQPAVTAEAVIALKTTRRRWRRRYASGGKILAC
jgi:hypothetical protein